MKITKNFGLNMPDEDDFVEIDKINENAEKIDEELAKKADASGGDISETVIKVAKESEEEYPVPAAGDSAKTVLGKIQKFFGDLRNWMTGVCLLGQIVNNCVTDNAKLPLSAAQGKVLMNLYNVLNTKATTFVGSAHRLHIRSGDNGLKNIYLDVYDGNGKGSSISFLSDGEKAISYSVNGEVVWKIKL